MQLKPNKTAEFTHTLEEKILPLLRFIGSDGTTAFAVSLWDKTESAETYGRETFPAVMKMLSALVEGTPKVETYEITNSTFHKIASKATV
jgi:hypothetical protein